MSGLAIVAMAVGAAAYVGAVVAAGRWLARLNRRPMYLWIVLAFGLCIPGYGLLCAAGLLIHQHFFAHLYTPWKPEKELELQSDADPIPLGAHALSQGFQTTMIIQSYYDIIRGSDLSLKKALIHKLQKTYSPQSVRLLKEFLADGIYEIRTYASTALQHLEKEFLEAIQDVKNLLRKRPSHGESTLLLTRYYLDYVESGLLSPGVESYYLALSADLLGRLSQPATDSASGAEQAVTTLKLQGQLARLKGDPAREYAMYQAILAQSPSDRGTLLHLSERLFKDRDFAGLKQACAALLTLPRLPLQFREAAGVWASGTGDSYDSIR